MRRIALITALCMQLLAGAAFAVSVDFSSLAETVDITNPNSLTLGRVTFSYDNFGSAADAAYADAGGIFGSTFGVLNLAFKGKGASGLAFDFQVTGVTEPVDALLALFDNGDAVQVAGRFRPNSEDIVGKLNYKTTNPFTSVALWFSPVANPDEFPPDSYTPYFFSISDVSFRGAGAIPEPVPEPATAALLLVGLAGIFTVRFYRRNVA